MDREADRWAGLLEHLGGSLEEQATTSPHPSWVRHRAWLGMAWADLAALFDDEPLLTAASQTVRGISKVYERGAVQRRLTIARARLGLHGGVAEWMEDADRAAATIEHSFFRDSARSHVASCRMGMPFPVRDLLEFPPRENPTASGSPAALGQALNAARELTTEHVRVGLLCALARAATDAEREDEAILYLEEADALSARAMGDVAVDPWDAWDFWTTDVPTSAFEPAAIVALGWSELGKSERVRRILEAWRVDQWRDAASVGPVPRPYARTYARLGRLSDAAALLNRARSEAEGRPLAGLAHWQIAREWAYCSLARRDPAPLETAEDVMEDALRFGEAQYLVRGYCDIGLGWNALGGTSRSERAMKRAEELLDATVALDPEPAMWGRIEGSCYLAKTWSAQGAFEPALQWFDDALDVSDSYRGHGRPSDRRAVLGRLLRSLRDALDGAYSWPPRGR